MNPGDGFDGGGAFGGAKAGASQDPLTFIKKPSVIVKICSLLFAIIVFGCISSQGWKYDQGQAKEICILNNSSSACHFPTGVGIIAFLASIGFLVGEWFFEQMPSVKTRKHYVLLDTGFSAVWAFFYFLALCVLAYSWHKTPQSMSYASSNIVGSMFFCVASFACWGASAFFAYQRYQQGLGNTFNEGFAEEDAGNDQTGYSNVGEEEAGYGEVPYNGGNQTGTDDYGRF